MHEARLRVSPEDVIGAVHSRLFGSFVEHLGRCVYGGIYEPDHPSADTHGFRMDVAALVGELGVTAVRYPGGNFVSGYRWEDGIGPRDRRPRRLDLAWRSTETNEVGVDDFLGWCRRLGLEPVLAVNLGTRGVEQALTLLEYVNHAGGTYWSDLRAAHGSASPYGVRTWCLGNEMDGPWQLGHMPADDYGRLAAKTAAAMKAYDPGLELVVCGSSSSGMPTFGSWERTVLEHTHDHVEAISCHAYYMQRPEDVPSFLASAVDMDRFIDTVTAIADEVAVERGSSKRIQISFDEWNVWYQAGAPSPLPSDWPVAPPLQEDDFDVTDAVVVGSLLMSLLRHCDRVTLACLAQLVNVVAPIRTTQEGAAWRQPTFHPFALTARLARGIVLRGVVEAPTVATQQYGDVPAVDAVVTYDEDAGSVSIFAVNRSVDEDAVLDLDLTVLGHLDVDQCLVLAAGDHHGRPPGEASPLAGTWSRDECGVVRVELPPVAWAVIRLA
jgi:alpha-L-arabinofuranosidase